MHIAQLLFPDFSLVAIGYLICRFTALDQPVWHALERMVYYFLFPVYLFVTIARAPLNPSTASTLILVALALSSCGVLMAYALPYIPGLRGRINLRDHAASTQIAFRFNSFIGLALASRLLGEPGAQVMAIYIGTCVPMSNIWAVYPMARHSSSGFWKALLQNPLLIATILALTFNLAGLNLATWVQQSMTRIGSSSIVLGLMAAGAGLQFLSLTKNRLLSTGMLSIRHFFMPLTAWGLAHFFGLNQTETLALLIFAAVPTSSSCYVLANVMGFNGAYVAGLITLSTLLALASLPFAMDWLGGI